MIRFSAGLVVVAIGVLIGGVATSKLSLVYIAVAVSAVALVVLAIGVALKRDELFGGGPESAPAGAGADSGMPAGQLVGAGDVRGSAGHVREDQKPIQKKVPGPATAAFEAAAAAQAAAVAAPTVAAPSMTTPTVASPTVVPAGDNSPFGGPPLGHRRTGFGQAPAAPEGKAAADWQARSPQAPWSAGNEFRPTWTPTAQTPTASPPAAPPSETASVPPRAWGNPDQSATRAGAGAPSWFDRLNQPAGGPVAPTGTDPAEAGPAKAEPQKAEPASALTQPAVVTADSGVADADDDDWPTRYSWLEDDETDEAAETADGAAAADGGAADTPTEAVHAADVADAAAPVPAEATQAAPVVAEAARPDLNSPDAAAEAHDAETVAGPADPTDETDHPGATRAVDAAPGDADRDAGADAPPRADSRLVTVIPGVPRYHDPDCILIRFMDEEDVVRKSVPEARAANCTPCAACQPES